MMIKWVSGFFWEERGGDYRLVQQFDMFVRRRGGRGVLIVLRSCG